jgi:hypothetical protein
LKKAYPKEEDIKIIFWETDKENNMRRKILLGPRTAQIKL